MYRRERDRDEGIITLANHFKYFPYLLSLNLSIIYIYYLGKNNIGDSGARFLIENFKFLSYLRKLNLG